MKFIKKHYCLIGIATLLVLAILFVVLTARDINVNENVGLDAQWNYTVKTNVISKKVTSEVIDLKYSHSATAIIGENVSTSGIVPAGDVAKAVTKGSILETAVVYWNTYEDKDDVK